MSKPTNRRRSWRKKNSSDEKPEELAVNSGLKSESIKEIDAEVPVASMKEEAAIVENNVNEEQKEVKADIPANPSAENVAIPSSSSLRSVPKMRVDDEKISPLAFCCF